MKSIGGGPTGVEMAGAIAELTRHAAKMDFHHITPKCVRILLMEGGPRLWASFPESLSIAAARSLKSLGVEVLLNARVTDIAKTGVEVNGRRVRAAAVIWAAGVMASPAASWLDITADRSGRVPVDASLEVTGFPDVFVIGDTAAVTDASGAAVPGIAPAAKQQGEHVGRLLSARFARRREPLPFRYHSRGSLATIGRKRAVAGSN